MYCTRHCDPDFKVTVLLHETYGEAEDHARETASEDGGHVEVFDMRLLHTEWPGETKDAAQYNGVRTGHDYPAAM